jgi:hypothetical protein
MVVEGALFHFVINFNSLWENECNMCVCVCVCVFSLQNVQNVWEFDFGL